MRTASGERVTRGRGGDFLFRRLPGSSRVIYDSGRTSAICAGDVNSRSGRLAAALSCSAVARTEAVLTAERRAVRMPCFFAGMMSSTIRTDVQYLPRLDVALGEFLQHAIEEGLAGLLHVDLVRKTRRSRCIRVSRLRSASCSASPRRSCSIGEALPIRQQSLLQPGVPKPLATLPPRPHNRSSPACWHERNRRFSRCIRSMRQRTPCRICNLSAAAFSSDCFHTLSTETSPASPLILNNLLVDRLQIGRRLPGLTSNPTS